MGRIAKDLRDESKSLIADLTAYRNTNHMSRAKIARKLHLKTPHTIYMWEKGLRTPTTRFTLKIMMLLGKNIPVEQFIKMTKRS